MQKENFLAQKENLLAQELKKIKSSRRNGSVGDYALRFTSEALQKALSRTPVADVYRTSEIAIENLRETAVWALSQTARTQCPGLSDYH